MMSELVTAISDIEQRAADYFTRSETVGSAGAMSQTRRESQHQMATKRVHFTDQADSEIHADQHRCSSDRISRGFQHSDPLFAAVHRLLEQVDTAANVVLLLLSECSPQQNIDHWGPLFAALIDDPILAIELSCEETVRQRSRLAVARRIPEITQSEQPGLCTLATECRSLKGKQADCWWKEVNAYFGLVLLNGAGLDLVTIDSILTKCSHAVYLIEYGSTSRAWAHQISSLIAARRTKALGCIARAAPIAA